MRNLKIKLLSVAAATLAVAGFAASASSGATSSPLNPLVPVPGVRCPAASNQVTDTVARIDMICRIPAEVWKDVICKDVNPCPDLPEVSGVDTIPEQIPVPTDKPPIDLIDRFFDPDPDGTPPDFGPIFEECQTNPLLTFCKTDPIPVPHIPDEPKIDIEDHTGEDDAVVTPKGYHCDPRTWTNFELVNEASVVFPGETQPRIVFLLNPDFPKVLLPAGDATQDPKLPSFLETASGSVDINGISTPYWDDDPRANESAYINPFDQGCVTVPNTPPTQLSADSLPPSAALPDPVVTQSIEVTWAWSPADPTTQIGDLSVDGGADITGYEVHAFTAATPSVDTGKGCTADGIDATGCTVAGLTNGVNYLFRVRAVNAAGKGPWSIATDPIAPQLPTRRGRPARLATAAKTARAPKAATRRAAGSAKKPKVTRPGLPQKLSMTQCEQSLVTAGECASVNGMIFTWAAPKSTGGAPITGYSVAAVQNNTLNTNEAPLIKRCETGPKVFKCNVDGLRRNFHDSILMMVHARNAKGLGPDATLRKSFIIQCTEDYHQTKCYMTIRLRTVIRISGRSNTDGSKTRLGCRYAPFVVRVKVSIRNPAFPSQPTAARNLLLGEAMNFICRLTLTQITKPVLTPAQKALQKKGYTVLQLKVNGLASKGSRERTASMPWSMIKSDKVLINSAVNGGLDPSTATPSYLGAPFVLNGGAAPLTRLDPQKVVGGSDGIVTWIGVVKKKGYYPMLVSWPFYQGGKTFFVFPASKAKK